MAVQCVRQLVSTGASHQPMDGGDGGGGDGGGEGGGGEGGGEGGFGGLATSEAPWHANALS